jgi:GntR family transcriptional regulator/MocR family aminotransferase
MEIAITLNHQSPRPLHRQLYDEMRQSILRGRLAAGERVPSTRALARSLGVSRATVTQSYEQLISEGYLQTAVGSGTSVSAELPDELLEARPAKTVRPVAAAKRSSVRLSAYGARLREIVREPAEPAEAISFKYCRPAVDQFPMEAWRRLLLRHYRAGDSMLLDYADDGCGQRPLREAIAAYLARARAVRCGADQVIVVNGSQQALHLIAQVMLDRGDAVILEEPGYLGARHAFQLQGARIRSAPVDDAGIVVDRLPTRPVKLAYVTPSHQFPTGAVLSLQRRLELLAWAETQGALLVEDDYDSEFRYGGRPIPTLQGLDQSDAVVYVGTFSKVLFPSLRIGYVVAPPSLAGVFERAKWLSDRHTPIVEQLALADFIREGHLERHLRRMRMLYDTRRQALVRALNERFGERVTILGENSGMHLMIRLRSGFGNAEVIRRAARAGVGLNDARIYYLGRLGGGEGEFVLGYASLSERKIHEGIKRLAKAIENPEQPKEAALHKILA